MEAQQYFTIIAHRGDSSAAPENTVQAFDAALQQGFRNFETDCQLSSDGAVVIVHDEKLGRVNDGTGAVAEHTLAQLQQLDAGSWFGAAFAGARMPTLQQLLQTYKGKAHIHLVSSLCCCSGPVERSAPHCCATIVDAALYSQRSVPSMVPFTSIFLGYAALPSRGRRNAIQCVAQHSTCCTAILQAVQSSFDVAAFPCAMLPC